MTSERTISIDFSPMKKRVNHRPQVRYINPGSQRLKNKLPAIVDYESLLENNGSLPKKIFIWLVDKRSPKGNFVVFFFVQGKFLAEPNKNGDCQIWYVGESSFGRRF